MTIAARSLPDTILYSVVTAAGGVDGMDNTDKGGAITLVSFDLDEAKKKVGQDTRLSVAKQIVNQDDINAALAKLNPIERFLIEQHFSPSAKKPVFRGAYDYDGVPGFDGQP
jgi:hypothetical protein